MKLVHMQTPTKSFLSHYKAPEDFRDKQLKVFWTATEIKVEKDIHDILTNFSEAEKHGVFTTLKLFTHYEAKAGEDYWTGRYMRMFPRHEFTSMASVFGMFELAVHAPFYNKINTLLNANDDGFYTDYVNTPILKSRMEFVDDVISCGDDLVSLAVFSMVEGVILYSSFAFLKHFQSLGKNKLLNVVRGINFSVRDENIHALATAWSFRELLRQKATSLWELELITTRVLESASVLYEHECQIIDMTFAHGDIEGITADQMKLFVQNRIDLCLGNLGIAPLFRSAQSSIGEWFYKGINNYSSNDFFSGQGREYSRDWDESSFIW